MNRKAHNQIVSFIWGIADDVLRDIFVRGKYRDIILPFTVLRRLDLLLEPTKKKVLEVHEQLKEAGLTAPEALEGLKQYTKYPFYNISPFTFEELKRYPDDIDTNLEVYLEGFSPNIQDIIRKFRVHNQLDRLEESGITLELIKKFTTVEINLSPLESTKLDGEVLPALTNLGMGYVFEELIRKFNEDNNEEAGEHFTPRDIIRLMAHLVFDPIKDKIEKGRTYLIYDPACGSGGMLSEAENFAQRITANKSKFYLYGQEVNPETYAICVADMLIKGENPEYISFGSTLSKDGFPEKKFDFMLSNPPYGKSWSSDSDTIVGEKKKIIDHRFTMGVPRSSDGQLLFLMNMAQKMKKTTELGSRVASVHNGSALFTGDAGGGESEIRRWLIENDYLDCIIGVPNSMFYNTGISTYIFLLSNRKPAHRKGKVQLIDTTKTYDKMRKSLGSKSNEFNKDQIKKIVNWYINFEENEQSKIFNNKDFGYSKITVERPLRLSAQFTQEAVDKLRFIDAIRDEMEWVYGKYKEEVYTNLKEHKKGIEAYLKDNEIKVSPANKKKLLSQDVWNKQKDIMEAAQGLMNYLEQEGLNEVSNDFNQYSKTIDKALKVLALKLGASEKKQMLNVVTWRNEDAAAIIKKKEKNGTIIYEADAQLRDTENVPLTDDIQSYFKKEVLPHVPDAWINASKTVVGYEISFTKYFYKYKPLRSLDDIREDIMALEEKNDGLLKKILL